ncbi:hypothetical protein [Salipiger sp. PrR003]|uniref:hypothetical protein n=1 Tax=Salipiger sp. PrR003 TaxID=2706776 RepID=UPI0013DA2F09|nr:hypothetical protein [Salipiger sp. PrR003]NDV52105.1 hypothetical protein [Salipiger sp. PrR003]
MRALAVAAALLATPALAQQAAILDFNGFTVKVQAQQQEVGGIRKPTQALADALAEDACASVNKTAHYQLYQTDKGFEFLVTYVCL